jgi:hypothetical protein
MEDPPMTTRTRGQDSRRWLLTAGILLAVGACATPASAPAATTAASAPPSVAPAPTTTASAPVAAGPTATASDTAAATDGRPPRVADTPMGLGRNPGYTVEIPSTGWAVDGKFVVRKAGPVVGFSVWDVARVPTDPCHPLTTFREPGPTVDDLVNALVAQKSRNASKPKEVTVDGHRGQYLEWSVPKDAKVVGDADFVGCDVQSNGHLDFVSWETDGGGERYQQEAGQVDRLWVLDVDGHRLLADATFSLAASQAARDELAAVAASLKFVDD